MSTEDLVNTTQEGAAGNGGVGGVSAVTTPETAVVQSTAPASSPENAVPDSEDFLAKVAAAFEGEDSDAVMRHVAVTDVEALSGKERGIVRALIAHRQAERDKSETKYAEREAVAAAREQSLAQAAADLRRREAALYSLANSPELDAARRNQKPKVDPLSPEGIEELAAFNAAKGVAKALDPIFQRSEEARKDYAYSELQEKYPVIKAQDAEFRAFMAEQNAGVKREDVLAGKARWRMTVDVGARLFAAEKRAEEAARAAETRRAAEVADRGLAARALNRVASGSYAEADLKIPDEVYERGEVTQYLARFTPERRAAILRFNAANA